MLPLPSLPRHGYLEDDFLEVPLRIMLAVIEQFQR